MNILLIAQAYPPYPAVGAFRARKIARAFCDAGHSVQVVTEQLSAGEEAQRPDDPGITVVPVAVGPRYRERITGLVRRARRNRGTAEPTASRASALAADRGGQINVRGGLLKRLVLAFLWFPDDEQRFIRPALRAARARISGADLVYTTAPSWSTLLVGLWLRRRYPVRWVVDYRDPWLELLKQRRPRTALTDALLARLESRILRAADHVVAVTAHTRDALAAKVPNAPPGKFLLARNGVDLVLPPRTQRTAGPVRITYAGSFYDNRDPRLFLRALALLRARRSLTPANLRIDFAGSCRVLGAVSIERLVADLGLGDLVHFHDWMPQDQARRLVAEADLLLILARGMSLQVPNKLYDGIGMRIPVLAWADEDGETAAVLRALPGHFVETGTEPNAMARLIEQAIDTAPVAATSPAQEALIEEWGADRQMAALVAAVASSPPQWIPPNGSPSPARGSSR